MTIFRIPIGVNIGTTNDKSTSFIMIAERPTAVTNQFFLPNQEAQYLAAMIHRYADPQFLETFATSFAVLESLRKQSKDATTFSQYVDTCDYWINQMKDRVEVKHDE